MKTEIKYIEKKSGSRHDGDAWIGLVSYSKTGKTIYFNGKAFQSSKGMAFSGNYSDIETGDDYWISGIKKDMTDRHIYGGGKIYVESRVLKEYLTLIKKTKLPKTGYELIELDTEIPIERIRKLENERLT